MLASARYLLGRLLPKAALEPLRKRYRRHQAARRRRDRDAAIARHGTFDAVELLDVLRRMGIEPGSTLFVQSSFNDLHTFSGRPIDLLDALRQLVGPAGTLLMPAYTAGLPNPDGSALDLGRLPTYTGIVNELFRRSPDAVRSLHPRHSICGAGPLAASLLEHHERCLYADGKDSPFDRLRRVEGAKILTLGLPAGFTSFLHWIEDIEPERLPFPVHDPAARHFALRDPQGTVVEVRDMHLRPEMASRLDLPAIVRTLTERQFRLVVHRGVSLGLYDVPAFAEQLVALRDAGILHYH